MNLKSFFEKFDQFADAPNAVAKMRELVLQLAMQGKLVEQRDADGTAAQLLSAISCERVTRVRSLRTPENQQPTNGDAHLFEIPSNWAWTKLGNVALQIQYGYTASADQSLTEIRMLRITDIQNNRVDWPSVPGCQIDQTDAEKYLLSQNDILIARTGGTIGKSFIVSEIPVKSVFASYLIRVTPPRSIEARSLKFFLESPLYWTQLRTMSAGTGQPNVNGQALGRLEFPLPPLAEQKRIVAKVDELMALCDRLETQQQERDTRHAALARASLARFADAPTPANLNLLFHPSYAIAPADLRKTILTLAVQGKLVPQDTNDGQVTGLCTTPNAQNLQPIDSKELPFELPGSWQWCRLGSLAELINGDRGKNYPNKVEYVPSGLPFINTGHIEPDGSLALEHMHYLTRAKFESLRSGKIQKGDLVYCLRGATLGKTAIVDQFDEGAVASSLVIIRLSKRLINRYTYYYLISPLGRELIRRFDNGSAQPNLSANSVKRYVIPVPPLAEQRRIVAKVDQLMALVDQLEAQFTTSRTAAVNLMDAVVAELTAKE